MDRMLSERVSRVVEGWPWAVDRGLVGQIGRNAGEFVGCEYVDDADDRCSAERDAGTRGGGEGEDYGVGGYVS